MGSSFIAAHQIAVNQLRVPPQQRSADGGIWRARKNSNYILIVRLSK
jgi:hypothetical protein